MIPLRLQQSLPFLGGAEAIACLAQLLQMTWPDGMEWFFETRPCN
jgi:hypothetical protein